MSFLLVMLVFHSCAINSDCTARDATAPKELQSRYTEIPLKIDAELDELAWKNTRSISFNDDTFRNFPAKSNNAVEVRSVWDESHLYFAFRVHDSDLRSIQTAHEHPDVSSDDIVEFLIDRSNEKRPCWNEHSIIYHINLHGRRKTDRGSKECRPDGVWHGGAEIAVKIFGTLNDDRDLDQGYVVEVAIAWSEIGIQPGPCLRLGANFANGDSRIFFDWAGARPFRSPDAFGDLVLVKDSK